MKFLARVHHACPEQIVVDQEEDHCECEHTSIGLTTCMCISFFHRSIHPYKEPNTHSLTQSQEKSITNLITSLVSTELAYVCSHQQLTRSSPGYKLHSAHWCRLQLFQPCAAFSCLISATSAWSLLLFIGIINIMLCLP